MAHYLNWSSMEGDNEALGREILTILEQDRQWRRQNPELFLAEIAEDLWRTMPDDEAIDDFRLRLKGVPWWASDVVECLERILRERPDWAAPTLVTASQRGPWLGSEPQSDPDSYLDWLAIQTHQMREALDSTRSGH